MGVIASLSQVLNFTGVFTKALDLTTPTEAIAINKSQSLTNGTGSGQANQVFTDQRTVSAASENLDLAGGLTDAFGDTITFTGIKMLMVKNLSTTAGQDLTLSGNFLDDDMLGGGSSTVILGPGGIFFISSPVDGFDVTAGTGDILTVDPAANTISYDIVLLGTVA